MKFVLFFLITGLIVRHLMQQRKQNALQQQRFQQEKAAKQAAFVKETDALNPHLRRKEPPTD